MIADLATALALQLGGVAFVLAAGLRRARLIIPLGFVAGAALLIFVSFWEAWLIDAILVVPTLLAVALLPVVWLAIVWRRGGLTGLSRGTLLAAGLSVPGAMLLAALLTVAAPVNFHVDTFEYLALGQQLAEQRFHGAFSLAQLEKRGLGVPALHAAAVLDDDLYVHSIIPMLAAACLALVVIFAFEGLRLRLTPRWTIVIAAGAGLLLVTMNRFVFNAFYINGHLLFATLLLVLAGASWIGVVHRAEGLERQLLAVQLLVIPALVATRPEAGLTALIALAPSLLDPGRELWQRITLAVGVGASMTVWQGFLIYEAIRRSTVPNISMLGLFALGLVICAISILLRWRWLTSHRRLVLWVAEAGLWAALVVLTLRSPEILGGSVDAAWWNVVVGTGGWGITLDVLAVLVIAVVMLLRDEDRIHLRYAVTTWVPLIFILAFLRDSPYRVHPADSMNRMMFQLVPLAVLLVAASAAAAWRWSRRQTGAAEAPEPVEPAETASATHA